MRILSASIAAGVALLSASLSAVQTGQDAGGKRSIWSGVYTDSQAERGHVQYLQSCSVCHGDDLKGDSAEEVPGLATEQFLQGWDGRTVRELVETIRRTMPGNSPGSLSTEAYIDLVAFILRSNKVPGGAEPLALDLSALERLVLETPKR